MPRKQVASAFNKRWREYLKRVAKRLDLHVDDVGIEVAELTRSALDDEAPWTGGGLLGKEKFPSAIREGRYPVTPTGFTVDIRKTGQVKTYVLKNVMWPIYGKDLEDGNVQYAPIWGGRAWRPGFVLRSLQIAKTQFKARRK